MSFKDACEEIVRHKGTQFDPDVVDAFFQLPLSYFKDILTAVNNKPCVPIKESLSEEVKLLI
jgi:HD-GYP domain-containing protein (c-di-GMP phosphodiesterase class II)